MPTLLLKAISYTEFYPAQNDREWNNFRINLTLRSLKVFHSLALSQLHRTARLSPALKEERQSWRETKLTVRKTIVEANKVDSRDKNDGFFTNGSTRKSVPVAHTGGCLFVSELIGDNTSLRIMEKLLITDLISCNFWLYSGVFVSAG